MTPLRWLIVGTFINRAGSGVRFLLVLYLASARGFSPAGAGAVATAWGVGALVAQPVMGALADAAGRRTVLVATMTGSAVALIALGAARAPWLIALCALVTGVLNEGSRPAVQAMIADLAAPDERARAFGWNYWATNAGFTLALAAGGLLASVSWWLVFASDAASCAAFAVVARLRLPETRPPADEHGAPRGYAAVLRDPRLLVLTLLQLCFGFILLQSASTLPLAMAADDLGAAAYGTVMAASGLAVVVLQPAVAGYLGRRDHALVLAVGLLLAGAGIASTGLATSLAGFAATCVAWTLGEIAIASVSGAMVADIAPVALRGRYMGVFATAFPLAGVLAPAVGTAVFEHAGEMALWGACGVLGAAAAVGAVGLSLARGSRRPA